MLSLIAENIKSNNFEITVFVAKIKSYSLLYQRNFASEIWLLFKRLTHEENYD